MGLLCDYEPSDEPSFQALLAGCAVKVVTGGAVISGAFLLNKIS